MPTPNEEHDRIAAQAREAMVRKDAGGRRTGPVGQGSLELRRRHQLRKVLNMTLALVAIVVVALSGLVLRGISISGIVVTLVAMIAAIVFFSIWPSLRVPGIGSLNQGNARTLVANTELWLESQRPALPASAADLVGQIGVQLDALGLQLDAIGDQTPAVGEVRKLIGEHLPGVISTYTAIPANLRQEQQAGSSPDRDLTDSLGKISAEIDNVSRQLASGQIDQLAITTRFLDYKYGAKDGLIPPAGQ